MGEDGRTGLLLIYALVLAPVCPLAPLVAEVVLVAGSRAFADGTAHVRRRRGIGGGGGGGSGAH